MDGWQFRADRTDGVGDGSSVRRRRTAWATEALSVLQNMCGIHAYRCFTVSRSTAPPPQLRSSCNRRKLTPIGTKSAQNINQRMEHLMNQMLPVASACNNRTSISQSNFIREGAEQRRHPDQSVKSPCSAECSSPKPPRAAGRGGAGARRHSAAGGRRGAHGGAGA
uniref:Uncharacterized protein n=1 Tax=Arundo donax TaxID=35708 RepID=A0A0A9F107_ARUDO